MKKNSNNKTEFSFFELFEKFILASKKGKRLQPNGNRISLGTIKNYLVTLRLLRLFSEEMKFEMRIVSANRFSRRGYETERNYWRKFYKKFTDFLYFKKNYFDNYVGLHIKNIKAFFNYLKNEMDLPVKEFYKQFYVRKENIAIFPLQPEELKFFISNKEFERKLNKRMLEVKEVKGIADR